MRRKLVAGNWKMNGGLALLAELGGIAEAARACAGVDIAVAVPCTLIAPAARAQPSLAIGAEDVHAAESGAHTGCVSAAMVREAGARFTIVGHSERRADQGETDADVRAKAQAAHRHGLAAILCVGETLEQHDAGHAERVVRAQLAASFPDDADGAWLSIAYEPVWAIGTGRVASVEVVARMHAVIRAQLRALAGEGAAAIRILYGGSVTADNAAALLGTPEVDGALVGGASLSATKFTPIIEAASELAG